MIFWSNESEKIDVFVVILKNVALTEIFPLM